MSTIKRDLTFDNELTNGKYDGKAENYPAMLRTLQNSLIAYRIPTQRPMHRPPLFLLLLHGQPYDPLTLTPDEYRELTIFEDKLARSHETGRQAVLCLTQLQGPASLQKLRPILEDATLTNDSWQKYQRILDYLQADIVGDTFNTIQRITAKIDQLEPVYRREHLEAAWLQYDHYVRQQSDLGTLTTDDQKKIIFHRLISQSDDFRELRTAISVVNHNDTYEDWKILALRHMRGIELTEIASKRFKTASNPFTHSMSTINAVDQDPRHSQSYSIYPPTTNPRRQMFSGCWNCRNPSHSSGDCPALYCRCCALQQRTCQWDSVSSPGFHRHYQCVDCRPQFRIPPTPTASPSTVGPFPIPYAHKRYSKRPKPQPYVPPITSKRTINQMEGQSEDDDEDYEDMLRVAIQDP